jgi:uncharacterized membrane protein YfcA
MQAIIYGIIGGIFALILFPFLSYAVNLGNDIAIATIILSTVISACTGIIVRKLDNK